MRRVRRWGSSPGNILLQPEPKKMGAVTSCKYTEVCQVTKSVKRDFFLGSGWSDIDRGQILFWSKCERDLGRPVDELTVSRNEELDHES